MLSSPATQAEAKWDQNLDKPPPMCPQRWLGMDLSCWLVFMRQRKLDSHHLVVASDQRMTVLKSVEICHFTTCLCSLYHFDFNSISLYSNFTPGSSCSATDFSNGSKSVLPLPYHLWPSLSLHCNALT